MSYEVPIDPSIIADYVANDVVEQRLVAVQEAVEALPELQRAVVELLHYGRHSKVEVAEQLGLHRSYVHKLWVQARDTLRAEFDDLFPDT